MALASLRQTKITILLSINAAAVLLAGVLVASAIFFNGDAMEYKVVDEKSDENGGAVAELAIVDPTSNTSNELTSDQQKYIATLYNTEGIDPTPVPDGELWAGDTIYMYETTNIDICVGGNLDNIGAMYWQTSNTAVISGFYTSARTWLGYSPSTCRMPVVTGTGKTTITAGTYDGTRRDSIDVIVLPVPEEKWKHEVLALVNQERVRNGLEKLTWGEACAPAAETRALEIVTVYEHTRPDGTDWDTACIEPDDGAITYYEGENIFVGNAAVSPETTVAGWMNSEKHRENILNPNYTKLAVGFYFNQSTQYQTHWSQYFSNF